MQRETKVIKRRLSKRVTVVCLEICQVLKDLIKDVSTGVTSYHTLKVKKGLHLKLVVLLCTLQKIERTETLSVVTMKGTQKKGLGVRPKI